MALPEPECGLVISYAYLWRHESETGQTEGLKDRPCAVVLAVAGAGGDPVTITVAPITHSPPRNPDLAIEMPMLTDGQFTVKSFAGKQLTQPHKHPHNADVDLDRALAVQDA